MGKSLQIKRIEEIVNNCLISIETQISARINSIYRRKVQVSIQLLKSGQWVYRPPPCNSRCFFAFKDLSLRDKCDKSDKAMKLTLSQQIGENINARTTIGYRCHQGLSNIVMPYWDEHVLKDYWYIFLGQFYLQPCLKGYDKLTDPETEDLICPDGFRSEDIRILNTKEIEFINANYNDCLLPGFFYEGNESQDTLDVDSLCIPEMLVCKVIATDMFANYLLTVHGNPPLCKKFIRWVRMHDEVKSDETAECSKGGYDRVKGDSDGS